MELRHLRYFIAVAEELHFSKAAERLHIAQPPLSQQIQQLEAELGVELFQRKTKRQVQLTEAGQVFLQEAYQLFAQLSKAIDLTQRTGRGEKGQLRVGFTSLVTYDLLPVILRRFREQFLEVELVLQELTTTEQEQALFNHRIHVGFAHPPLEDNTFNQECIQQEVLIVAMLETHFLARQENISVRSLLNENFIMFPRHLGPGLYDQILSLCQQGNFSPKVTQEAIQMQTIIGLVSAGMGIAIVPSSLQNLQRAGVVYRTLEEKTPLVETAVVWRQEDMTPVLREALVCGYNHPQGYLVAIDCDGETSWRQIIQINEHTEPEELNQLTPVEAHGTPMESLHDRAQKYLPPTIAFTSGRKYRSQRLYLIPNSKAWEVKSRKIKTGKDEHLEFRGKNLASILPPSFHPEGRNYKWLPGCSPCERQIEIAPDWVIAQMLAKQEKARKFNLPQEKYNRRYGVDRYAHLIPSIETNIQTALVLLEVIHPRFADDYHSWIQVGMALHSVSPILFKAWDTWSQLSPKYKSGECAYKWQSFNKTGITIRTLFRLANLS